MSGAQEDIVHALDRPGAVLRPAQVEGQDLRARDRGLQRLFHGLSGANGVSGGQSERQIGSMNPAPPAISTFLSVKSILVGSLLSTKNHN